MSKFDPIIEKYTRKGVSADNIDYALISVRDGARREHILEDLTADYRGMDREQAVALLEDLFDANGGEFKKENRGGYLFGSLFLAMGLACGYHIFYVLTYGGTMIKPVYVIAGALSGIGGGTYYTTKALLGKFRDQDAPFQE